MAAQEPALTPRDALRCIAEVAARDDSLKARTEGLTWAVWGMANAGAALTYAALSPEAMPPPLWTAPVAGLWVVAGILATVGLWRSAALAFPTGMTWRRGLAFFVAWPLLTGLLAGGFLALAGFELLTVAKVVATGVLLVGFALLDPLGFTRSGRATALALGMVALAAGAAGWWLGATGVDALLLLAATMGGAWVAGGLAALWRA